MGRWTLVAAITAAFLLPGAAQAATTAQLSVPGTADVFAAGQATVPNLPGGGGTLPAALGIPVFPGQVITFPSVTGSVFCDSSHVPTTTPDGPCQGVPSPTNLTASGGISGIIAGSNDFPTGVFLGDAVPTGNPPASLDFSTRGLGMDFTTLSPQVAQTFFIGDGRTTAGTLQRFVVPAGATRLFVGIADGSSFGGTPGFYSDNGGAYTVEADVAAPQPVLGRAVDGAPVSGQVFVRLPGGQVVPLSSPRLLPNGTQIDARSGTIDLGAAAGGGRVQQATFSGAVFSTSQARSGSSRGLTTLQLLESGFPGAPSYAGCGARAASLSPDFWGPTASAAARRPKVLQTLRARDFHGRFRTRGRFSSATVRGTVWETSDRCDGTLTRVRSGTVVVRDFRLRRNVVVHAGHSYLARRG